MYEPAASPSIAPSFPDADETRRFRTFLVVQALFLAVTPLTGGFHFKVWSMLDTALMLAAIGTTALVVVLENPAQRRVALRLGTALYVLAVLDMSVNVVISGVVGWDMD